MKEKVKQTMGGLHKSVRAAGVGLSTLAASFFHVRTGLCGWCGGQPDRDGHRAVDWRSDYMAHGPGPGGVRPAYHLLLHPARHGRRDGSEEVEQPHCGGGGVLHRRRFGFRHPEPDPRLLSVSRGRFRSTGDYHALLSKSIHQ